jgi:quercetin dioxygenase-like cupin family protein
MYFNNPEDRKRKLLVPGIQIRTFWGENMLLSVVDFEANAVVPAHSHPQEQIIYLIEGNIIVDVGGETHSLRAGEFVIVPGGVEHSAKVGPDSARGLDIFSPVREDLKY